MKCESLRYSKGDRMTFRSIEVTTTSLLSKRGKIFKIKSVIFADKQNDEQLSERKKRANEVARKRAMKQDSEQGSGLTSEQGKELVNMGADHLKI